ncbi:MAG: cytochrome C biogenesis protein CcsB [Chloroflexi bacterium]|nr:cytochrome C biogenesis protein CcsB [Chloroflexota bacterium]
MPENISFAVAFGAGLLSFVSPCVLPLVPVYLASLWGPEIFEPDAKRRRVPMFLHALSFVGGFSAVFIILGVSAGLVGFVIGLHLALMRQIAGSLLIAFGVFMLLAAKIPRLNFEKRLTHSQGIATGYLRSFFTGAIFSLAWTPCVGPILGGILTLAMASETAAQGGALLAIYSLGLGLPFLIIGVAFDALAPLLKRIQRYSNLIYLISGALLIAIGILTLANRLIWF